jgi:hypothetical protein
MTKKDYELIAKTLLNTPIASGVDSLFTWGRTCEDFARALGKENPRFNTVTFLDACGFDIAFGYEWRSQYNADGGIW